MTGRGAGKGEMKKFLPISDGQAWSAERREIMKRLDKILAEAGLGTRSQVRGMIRDGRVSIGGAVVRRPEQHVDEQDAEVRVDGNPVNRPAQVYLMLNKPAGIITATKDPRQKTVLDLLPPEYRSRGVFPVGRLDKDTVGLLLLTNDGAAAHALSAPRRHAEKVYFVRVSGRLERADADAFGGGMVLKNGDICRPAGLEILRSGDESEAEVTLHEGKYHQVKRMFAARGMRVIFLKRVAVAGIVLDESLPEGQYRPLQQYEINLILLNAVQNLKTVKK